MFEKLSWKIFVLYDNLEKFIEKYNESINQLVKNISIFKTEMKNWVSMLTPN